ncbi:hypothetical protein [Ochrobactrum sp. AN78]|uniref:hypothetical protein n=1 Tax=Ochrobactrum sp. AN78 TaxID=3039853 RepID=UPI002989D71F|nr:hypothetical protein [Ochrobactrum sp. AN78]MDH7791620.1 hypothetical protein [Ochrobactrum sp. AN78]
MAVCGSYLCKYSAILLLAILNSVVAGPGLTQTSTENVERRSPGVPLQLERSSLISLVRYTLVALDQANRTGNYSVLRELGAPGFMQSNNPAHLAEIFANQRKDLLDMSAVTILEPQFTFGPQIEQNGMLHVAGFFPAGTMRLSFEFLFQPVERQFRVFTLAVALHEPAKETASTEKNENSGKSKTSAKTESVNQKPVNAPERVQKESAAKVAVPSQKPSPKSDGLY